MKETPDIGRRVYGQNGFFNSILWSDAVTLYVTGFTDYMATLIGTGLGALRVLLNMTMLMRGLSNCDSED